MSFECGRCGNCCIDVGRTFWKNGDFEGVPGLNNRANDGDSEDGGLPCAMLSFDENGKAVCGVEQVYGRKYKPKVCREYQGDERCAMQRAGQKGLFE